MKNLLLLGSFFYLSGLLCLAPLRPALAATDDVAFNSCLKELHQQSDVLKTNSWYETSPPPAIQRFEEALSADGHIQRWTFHKNINGAVALIVLERGNDAAPADDPDDFDVFLERKGIIVYIETFGVNAEGPELPELTVSYRASREISGAGSPGTDMTGSRCKR
jgi:hypothetical protein